MPWQCSFKKIMLFCSNYAKNYASTIRQGLIVRPSSRLKKRRQISHFMEFVSYYRLPVSGWNLKKVTM